VTVGVVHLEEPLAPRGVLWRSRSESFFLEVRPECIHITHVEDYSSPPIYYMVLFKVEDRKPSLWSSQRRESRTGSAVE